ncbi:MAG: KEOPS complex subunit Pcc1 [Candidatus Diapherotrites archaeon]
MKPKYEFSLKVLFPSAENAEVIINSFKPEFKREPSNRASSRALRKKNVLQLNIKALDLTALKASMNSALKAIILSHKLIELQTK